MFSNQTKTCLLVSAFTVSLGLARQASAQQTPGQRALEMVTSEAYCKHWDWGSDGWGVECEDPFTGYSEYDAYYHDGSRITYHYDDEGDLYYINFHNPAPDDPSADYLKPWERNPLILGQPEPPLEPSKISLEEALQLLGLGLFGNGSSFAQGQGDRGSLINPADDDKFQLPKTKKQPAEQLPTDPSTIGLDDALLGMGSDMGFANLLDLTNAMYVQLHNPVENQGDGGGGGPSVADSLGKSAENAPSIPNQLDLDFQSLVNPTESTGLPSSKFKGPKPEPEGPKPGGPDGPGPDWWSQFENGQDGFGPTGAGDSFGLFPPGSGGGSSPGPLGGSSAPPHSPGSSVGRFGRFGSQSANSNLIHTMGTRSPLRMGRPPR